MTKSGGVREIHVSNPTTSLLDSLNSNSFSRIRAALLVPSLDLNYRDPDSDYQTPLMRICRLNLTTRCRCDLMRMVINKLGKDFDVNKQDIKGMSALAHVCITGDDQLVRLLAGDPYVDPNLADDNGYTPLMHACCCGKTNVVAALMSCFGHSELKVDEPDHDGITPLMAAASQGFSEMCRILVSNGHADVSLRSNVNCTAKDYAIEHGRCNTPELLLLDSVAQRKMRARQARKAMGRSILNDFCPEIRLAKPVPVVGTMDHTAKKLRDMPLSREYIEQMNSIVFQVGKNLERLPEDMDGEAREILNDQCMLLRCKGKKTKAPRRMSVQNNIADNISKLGDRRRSLPLCDKTIKLGSVQEEESQEASTKKTVRSIKLPRVPRTDKGSPQNLSTSPTSPRSYSSFSPRKVSTKEQSPRNSAQIVKVSNRQSSAGSKNTGNWAGKSSTSVPSYLFR